nr:MAG TPA: terminase large subunit [Caudoviricetes sp.]
MNIAVKANACFRKIDQSRKRYIVMKGSAGSGKSVDTAQHYILRLMKDTGRNLLCVRKADVTNRDSTFAELQGAIFRMFGEQYKKYWYINSSNMLLECKSNHNQIIFRGVNDEKQREKLKSITFKRGKLTDVWIEEATEITQADFEIIDDRLRGELPPGQFYQIRMTFNPVSAHHWIKAQFFDREDADVCTHQSTYHNNRFIDAAYHRRMQRRKEVDPEGYRVYGLGEWGETEGLILKNYIVEDFDRSPERFDYVVNAQDFGFNHANCVGEVGFKDGELYLCQELYVYEMDTEEIIQLAEGKFNKRLRMWCDSAEPDRIKMWQKAGYRAKGVKKELNSVHAQIDYLKQHKIHIHPSCVNTIKEIQQWKWKKDDRTNTYLDEPVPFFDDAMAMLRYAIEQERKAPARLNKNKSLKGGL